MSNNIDTKIRKTISDAIKVTFLLMINLTHNNGKFFFFNFFFLNIFLIQENGCNKIANNNDLINSLFFCIHLLIDFISESEKFDVLIMVTIYSFIFDSYFEGNFSFNLQALGVILNLFHLNKQYQQKFIKKIPLNNDQSISSLDIIIKVCN